MAGPYNAQVHQKWREAPLAASSRASARSTAMYGPSANSSPPSSMSPMSPGIRRVYGSSEHTAQVTRSPNGTTVVNYNATGYQQGSPSPSYGGTYAPT
ncbi:hypothetical protein XA68_11258 [Ophiocordyceps unilateralis]|uniref:Uncharacterized protein n=1 Tax=Ophiocordyceps unilateralis TaxID=268505 RepID=A0A2A9NY51_OPHUN|nr:hypothetical protein XA68_11258 [Ophiocordyceps unilateralis]